MAQILVVLIVDVDLLSMAWLRLDDEVRVGDVLVGLNLVLILKLSCVQVIVVGLDAHS